MLAIATTRPRSDAGPMLTDPDVGLAGFEKDAIRELDPIYNLRMAGYNVARLALIGKWYLLEREKSRRSMKRPNQTLKSVLRIPGHRITFHGTLAH